MFDWAFSVSAASILRPRVSIQAGNTPKMEAFCWIVGNTILRVNLLGLHFLEGSGGITSEQQRKMLDKSLKTSRNTLVWVRDFTGHLRHQTTEPVRNRMVVEQAAIRVLDRAGGTDLSWAYSGLHGNVCHAIP